MLKPNAKTVKLKEQVINDRSTGLMMIFRLTPNGESRLHLMGEILPFGNRDFQFNKDGELVGRGTGTSNCDILDVPDGVVYDED